MVVELLRPQNISLQASSNRTTTSSIHPPNRRTSKRSEPTSALELARELSNSAVYDPANVALLAQLTEQQLPQGSTAERLQLYFALSRLFDQQLSPSENARQIVDLLLDHVAPLVQSIAPNLRWTPLASMASLFDHPAVSNTARLLGIGQFCALFPIALADAAPHDKATVYGILHDMHARRAVSTANANRLLASNINSLASAIRDAQPRLRRQLLEQHIALLESRSGLSLQVIGQVQSIISEYAPLVGETLTDNDRSAFERSVRRSLI